MNDVSATIPRGRITIAGIDLEISDRGTGRPLLYLHGGAGITGDRAFLELLANNRRVVAPSHPGYGTSGMPDWLDSVEDIAHVHLELMDRLGLDHIDLIGMSIGGWIACEMVTKAPARFKRLVLIGPAGVKTGSADKLDIPEIFATAQNKLERLLYHDPDKMRPDIKAMSDEQIAIMARNRETSALLGWEPYLHNPKLPHRLQRATMPTLFLRGVSDGIITADYVERYAKLFPDARIATIAAAGHAPQVEQPQATAQKVLEFLQ
jgi:pimeloyl-ACP methyl ester carboxylesterase